jgi:hypothetical protein
MEDSKLCNESTSIAELSFEDQEQKVTKEEEITVEDTTTRIHSDHLENTQDEDDDEFGDFENVQEESMHNKAESLMVKEDIHLSFVSNVSKVFQNVFKTNSSSSIRMAEEETKEMETAAVACFSLEMSMVCFTLYNIWSLFPRLIYIFIYIDRIYAQTTKKRVL